MKTLVIAIFVVAFSSLVYADNEQPTRNLPLSENAINDECIDIEDVFMTGIAEVLCIKKGDASRKVSLKMPAYTDGRGDYFVGNRGKYKAYRNEYKTYCGIDVSNYYWMANAKAEGEYWFFEIYCD